MLDAAVSRTAPRSPLARDPDALAEAADGVLTVDDQALLQRPEARQFWSPDDISLLDELAELIGKQPETAADRAARRRQAAEEAEQLRLAQDSLASPGLGEQLARAEVVASRYRDMAAPTGAERAQADRDRVHGHVVVDEAQELSHMAWRMVFRRCPIRSLTVVGDVDQTISPTGTTRWADVFDVHPPG